VGRFTGRCSEAPAFSAAALRRLSLAHREGGWQHNRDAQARDRLPQHQAGAQNKRKSGVRGSLGISSVSRRRHYSSGWPANRPGLGALESKAGKTTSCLHRRGPRSSTHSCQNGSKLMMADSELQPTTVMQWRCDFLGRGSVLAVMRDAVSTSVEADEDIIAFTEQGIRTVSRASWMLASF
jgi:hypothetical protein